MRIKIHNTRWNLLQDEFAAARQEHYSMKNALQRGKALLQEEDEEDDDSGKEGGLVGVDGSSN